MLINGQSLAYHHTTTTSCRSITLINLNPMGSETTSTDATDTSQNWKFPEINLVMKNVDDSTSQEILSHFSSERLMYNIFAEALMSLYNPDMANAPKDVKDITIVFRKMDGIAYTADAGDGLKEIHISLDHFADAGNRIEEELRGILWQETVWTRFFPRLHDSEKPPK